MEDNELKLRSMLGKEGARALSSVLVEPQIRKACLEQLADFGCRPPANHLVLLAVEKLLVMGGNLLGEATASRIEVALSKIPAAQKFFSWLQQLDRIEADRDRLKRRILQTLEADAASLMVDEATDAQVLAAIYEQKALEDVSRDVRELLSTLRSAIGGVLSELEAERANPVLGWARIQTPRDRRSASARITYTSGEYAFVGRDAELDFLHRFVGDASYAGPLARFRWLAVTGPGGEGKSRLAFEFSNALAAQGWRAGRMRLDDIERFDPSRWLPDRPTLIVIDYPAQAPECVGDLLRGLQANSERFDRPVRALLLERDFASDWARKMMPETSDGRAVQGHIHVHDGEALEQGWALPPLDVKAVLSLMRARIEAEHLHVLDEVKLLEFAYRIDRRHDQDGNLLPPRALFAAAATELVIENAKLEGATIEAAIAAVDRLAVIHGLLQRDRATRWEVAAENRIALSLHENLVAVATLAGGFALKGLTEADADARANLPSLRVKEPYPCDAALLHAISESERGYVAPLEPDIVGELFLLDHFASLDPELVTAFVNTAFKLGGERTAAVLVRILNDFPERLPELHRLLPTPSAGLSAARAVVVLAAELVFSSEQMRERLPADHPVWNYKAEVLARTEGMRTAYGDDPAFGELCTGLDTYVAMDAARRQDWGAAEKGLARAWWDFRRYARQGEVTDMLAEALERCAQMAGHEDEWVRARRYCRLLAALHRRAADPAAVGRRYSDALEGLVLSAGVGQQWEDVEFFIAEAEGLWRSHPDDVAIVAHYARALSEFAGTGASHSREDLFDLGVQLIRTHQRGDVEPIFIREEAKLLAYVEDHYGSRSFVSVEAFGARLDALLERAPHDFETVDAWSRFIKRRSTAAFDAGDLHLAFGLIERLDSLRSSGALDGPGSVELARDEARIWIHILMKRIELPDRPFIRVTLDAVDRLRAAFPDDFELARQEARAARELAMIGDSRNQPDLIAEAWERFDRVENAYPRHKSVGRVKEDAFPILIEFANGRGRMDWLIQLREEMRSMMRNDPAARYNVPDFIMLVYLALRVQRVDQSKEDIREAAAYAVRNPGRGSSGKMSLDVLKDAHALLPDDAHIARSYRDAAHFLHRRSHIEKETAGSTAFRPDLRRPS